MPLTAGVTYAALLLASGLNYNGSINPARDFFPRVLAYLFGNGDAFNGYVWIPIVMKSSN